MGMPIITPGTGTRDQAITDLIESVALQETAISHILNAEGKKMQAIIAMPDATLEDLMNMNDSVNKLVNAATRLEMIFLSKLELFAGQKSPDPTNAAAELAKINVPSVVINVPLDDPTAQQAAVAQAIAAAQAQVDPGYTVSFAPTGYDPTGSLTGVFTVTNDTNPTDTATDAADRTIAVTSTATTAADELAKINVTAVTIPVPLNDPTAESYAVAQAVSAAQAQVDPGYNVSFAPTGYDPLTGTLTGLFTVTNSTDPADTATDITPRNIAVTYTPSTATAESNAASQFLSGTLLANVPAGSVTGLDGVSAQYINGTTSGTNVTNTSSVDLTALASAPITVNALPLPLGQLLQLGAVNQYAQASIDGASTAFDGAVSNSGIVSINGDPNYPANATLDLMQILPSTPVLTQADLTLGAIVGAAQWSASNNAPVASTTSVTNPVQGLTYNIAGATLDLNSPLLSDLTSLFDTVSTDASNVVSGAISTALETGINAAASLLGPLSGGALTFNGFTIDVQLVDLATELAPLLQQPVTSGDGVVTIEAYDGIVTVDLNQLLGINNLPPNTELLSSTVINQIVADLDEVLQALLSKVEALIISKLTGTANVTINGTVDVNVPVVGSSTLTISYSGSLYDLVSGTQPLTITGTGLLALFDFGPFVSLVQSTLGPLVNTAIGTSTSGGILNTALDSLAGDITNVSTLLDPVFALISSVVSIIINVQVYDPSANTYTEIPIQFNLINDLTTLNLGKVVVGPNTYTA